MADILIKSGISIKRRWADIEENCGNNALSLDSELFLENNEKY